jgi:hypothetical protein
MNTYSEFHDGYLEGLHIDKDEKFVRVYLSSLDGKRTTVSVTGVLMLRAGGFREGNIILDVVIRAADEITLSDITALYELDPDKKSQVWQDKLMEKIKEKQLQILEVNPSYGGSCIVLAQGIEFIANSGVNG